MRKYEIENYKSGKNYLMVPATDIETSEDQYEKSVEGIDYIELNPEVENFQPQHIPSPPNFELITNILGFMAILLVVGVIIYFVVLVIRKRSKGNVVGNTSRIKALSLKDAEENLDMRDLSHLLAKAEEEKDYKLLIRLHYLSTLQFLNDQDYIVWRIQKTDFHYLSEVKKQSFHISFYHLITLFQNTWYGLTQPDEGDVKAALFFINRVKNKALK